LVMGSSPTVCAPFIQNFRASADGLISRVALIAIVLIITPSPITINTAKSRCLGCGQVFTHHSYAQHIAKTHHACCSAMNAASQPQFIFQSFPYELVFLTSIQNLTSWGYPDRLFGSEGPSGRDRSPSHLPVYFAVG